jgi:predicted NBD/HSP70 family sugar kinase
MNTMGAIGIDIGGTSIKAAAVDGTTVLARAQSDAYSMPTPDELREALRQVLSRLQLSGSFTSGQAVELGVCAPGVFDGDGLRIIRAVNLPGVVGLDLRETASQLVREITGVSVPQPVKVATDAHAAAYGHWYIHQTSGRSLSLVMGTGVGACVLDNATLLKVTGASCGHLGQIDVGCLSIEPAFQSSDGSTGTLEAYIGLAALRARYGHDPLTAWLAAPISAAPWRALAGAIRTTHAIFRPDRIVLLGGVGSRLLLRLEDLRHLVDQGLTSVAREGWILECGESDTGATGVAWLACAR